MLLAVVIAGMLTAAPQDLPRFTMTPEPGDALKAELFRLASGDPEAQARSLLGGDQAEAGAFNLHAAGPLMMMYREDAGPAGGLVLYAGAEAGHRPDAACLLTRNPDGQQNNARRATDWCLSFILKTAPTLNIPPAPL
ncbi:MULTISPECIES: hypothetical protein [unclassified Brevundimonas]|uniref:hypothetical protein n=1 Tax=unclassified Brevundimonas TaxID=2622653 RepID=UPI0025BA5C90|nr:MULTISPECIES: hypothetical protein [unclassified Brevundimonas]